MKKNECNATLHDQPQTDVTLPGVPVDCLESILEYAYVSVLVYW